MKILACLLALVSLSAIAHTTHVNYSKDLEATVDITDLSILQKIRNLDIDIAGIDSKSHIADLIVSEQDLKKLSSIGIEAKVQVTKYIQRKLDDEYKNPQEVEQLLKEIHQNYRDITRLEVIGQSLEGRNIWAMVISDTPNLKDHSEPTVLFNGMHHAREVMTPEVIFDIIEVLTNGYGTDEKVTNWVNNNEIWLVPMLNVDGNNIVWTRDNMWRKNARGGHGVDINRNYPWMWGKCNGSSGRASAQDYRGPKAASEPETNVMMNLVAKIRPVFDISYHSYSELVIYPYGCKGERSQTQEIVEGIGKEIGYLLDYKPGTSWETLYSTDGGDIDWMYGEYQVIPYVIEVSSRWEGFQPDYNTYRDKTVQHNRAGWQYILNRLEESSIRGRVLTADGKALKSDYKLKIWKVREDGSEKLFQDYRGHESGVFHIVVKPGNYRVEVVSGSRSIASKAYSVSNTRENGDIQINL